MNYLVEDIRKNSGLGNLEESILPVVFHPFKSARMIKSLMKMVREYKEINLIKNHKIHKALGYIEFEIEGATKPLTYRVSITGHKRKSDEEKIVRARKARKEKLRFVGKVKSPFRILKLKETGFYNVFEILLETMEEDIQRDKILEYFNESDLKEYGQKIRKAKAITIRSRKIEDGDVSVSMNATE